MDKNRCMVCAKEGAFEGGICDLCKAIIRGEALEGQHQIKKDADKSLHKEGTEIERKHGRVSGYRRPPGRSRRRRGAQ